MIICGVVASASALNLGTDFKSVPSMPPPDSFNRGLAPPCIWNILERQLWRHRKKVVIPAKAGIQKALKTWDSRLHGNDNLGHLRRNSEV